MLGAEDLGIRIVVKEPELGSPGYEHRELGIQKQADDAA
jgi:hypothetical protein